MHDSLLETLKQFGCEDLNNTMERFLNDNEFYLEMLQQMLTDPGFESLRSELEADHVTDAFETAHMLKGIIANCGITPMLKTISSIVEPLRAGSAQGLLPYYEQLMAQRQALCCQLA